MINHDCLPTLMLLYVMLYIVLACLMLFAALSNAVCLYGASFLPLISANLFISVLCLCFFHFFLFASGTVLLIFFFFS